MGKKVVSADGLTKYADLSGSRAAVLPSGIWCSAEVTRILTYGADYVQVGDVELNVPDVQDGDVSVTATGGAFFLVVPSLPLWSVYQFNTSGAQANVWANLVGFPFDGSATSSGVSFVTGTTVLYFIGGTIRGYDYVSQTDLGVFISKPGYVCRGIVQIDGGWLVGWTNEDEVTPGVIVRYSAEYVEQVSWEVETGGRKFEMALGVDPATVWVLIVDFEKTVQIAMRIFLHEDGTLLQSWSGPEYQGFDVFTDPVPFFVAPAVTGPIDIQDIAPVPTTPGQGPDPPFGVGYDIPLPNNIVTVSSAIEALIAEGADLNGGCGAFRIVTRVVSLLASEGLGAGFLKYVATAYNTEWVQASQICGLRWSYIVAYPSGAFFYILSGEGDTNHAEWVFGGFAPVDYYVAP